MDSPQRALPSAPVAMGLLCPWGGSEGAQGSVGRQGQAVLQGEHLSHARLCLCWQQGGESREGSREPSPR